MNKVKWYNNSEKEIQLKDSDPIPKGFVKGRLPRPKKVDYLKTVISKEDLYNKFIVENIPFKELPEKYVLKCNHNSGLGMYICKNKKNINIRKVKQNLKKGLKQNYFLTGREWPYKNVKPRIIAEKYMEDSSGGLIDYKFFCFNGYVDCVMVCLDRHINDVKFYFFDKDWRIKKLNKRGLMVSDDFKIDKPICIDKMFEIAAILSKDLPFCRIDLYECNDKIYFGEFTFFPDSGFDANLLAETDLYFGELIDLEIPLKKKEDCNENSGISNK